MATKTFGIGANLRYEAAESVRYNGVKGVIWIKRIKCADGSGWMHDGKQFLSSRATRKQIVEQFGQIFRSDQVNN